MSTLPPSPLNTGTPEPEVVTGVQLMQGIGARPSQGFWGDAWSQVRKKPTAVAAMIWLGLVAFFAVFAPVIASGHPLWQRTLDQRTAAQAGNGIVSFLGNRDDHAVERVRRALEIELSRHSPALPVDRFMPTPGPDGRISRAQVEQLAAALRATPELDQTGGVVRSFSPLWENLDPLDALLLVWVPVGLVVVLFGRRSGRSGRLGAFLGGLVLAVLMLAVAGVIMGRMEASATEAARAAQSLAARTGVLPEPVVPFVRTPSAPLVVGGLTAVVLGVAAIFMPMGRLRTRCVVVLLAMVVATWAMATRTDRGRERFDYYQRSLAGEITYSGRTIVPWSPFQRFSELSRQEPGSSRWRGLIREAAAPVPIGRGATREQLEAVRERLTESLNDRRRAPQPVLGADRDAAAAAVLARLSVITPEQGMDRLALIRALDAVVPGSFIAGTDRDGADVLSQLLHASRLSISIGLVSTGVALLIGVTLGALMGYFGGWVDLVLYRIVEVFMAVPVLFLLIVAASVLPEEFRTTYVMMAIIGCFTWTGMARFTRAEFLKLRNQDFVQAAQSAGLPLRSILFRHMLPNGVAPVLVDTSFAIAAAISVEATLSYLGLGPVDSASWGKLLASAISSEGEFKWWLAVFPGLAIFLTVLAYNLIGEALRDAIDPKLKKARV